THLLALNFSGASGDDLDTDDDGVLDILPWDAVVDLIALVEEPNPPLATEFHYGPSSGTCVAADNCNEIGPDATFVPSHAKRCSDGGTWFISAFDPTLGTDTPGASNDSGPVACDLQCFPLTGLVCDADCVTGNLVLSWVNGGTYTDITVELFDASAVLVDSIALAGDATTTGFAALANGAYSVTVTANCTGGLSVTASCTFNVAVYSGESNIIVALEGANGAVDSVGALATAFGVAGKDYVIVDSLAYACLDQLQPNDVVWVMLGTFPNEASLSETDAQVLIALLSSGVSIYIESSDHWGFDDPTSFLDYDGVDGGLLDGTVIADGDDTFLGMVGSTFENVELAGVAASYTQDNAAGDDFTDQLVPAGTAFSNDIPGGNSGVIWSDDSTGGSLVAYDTGIYTKNLDPYGDVLAQSWEFGGYGGDQTSLAQIYAAALKRTTGGSCNSCVGLRADANADGMINIADAVSILGFLFTGGSAPVPCPEVGDVNGDGLLNIADAVSLLAFLFSGGPAPVAPGYPSAECLDL
ncbi:MAG: dockerin type I repeat-containing protein, partial [Planctomycetes bacterium]|nr:dockerin type I repeat-containing protein [Planctomycetota bacterium]